MKLRWIVQILYTISGISFTLKIGSIIWYSCHPVLSIFLFFGLCTLLLASVYDVWKVKQ